MAAFKLRPAPLAHIFCDRFQYQASFCHLADTDKAMSDSPPKNYHRSHSKPPQVEAVEIDKSSHRVASSPTLRGRIRRLFLYQDHSSGSRSELNSIRSGPHLLMMASWMKVKTGLPKTLYANMLPLLFTGLLAGFVVHPVVFASIRNSRALDGIGRAGKTVFSAAQDAPLFVVAGTGFICGLVAFSWLCWGNRVKYVWLTDCVFFPAVLESVLTLVTALVNICAARGRHWIVTAFTTAAVTTSATLAAVLIYMIYVGLTGSAWEEHAH